MAYFSRHYRIRPGRQRPGGPTTRIVAGLEEFTLAMFGADNSVMQLAIVPFAADRRFRQLKDPDVFTAVLRTIPACAAWLEVLDPISPVFQMTGPRNTLRRLVVDGVPVVTGLHAVGDSVCTTNPTFGRGLSLAMWGAADLTDVIDKHADDYGRTGSRPRITGSPNTSPPTTRSKPQSTPPGSRPCATPSWATPRPRRHHSTRADQFHPAACGSLLRPHGVPRLLEAHVHALPPQTRSTATRVVTCTNRHPEGSKASRSSNLEDTSTPESLRQPVNSY